MKNYIKIHYISVLILFLVIGCKNKTEKTEKDSAQKITNELSIIANYVSEDYIKRSEGYDWVSVSVTKEKNNQLNISIRSRADNKKPTCTLDAIDRFLKVS